MDQETKKQIKRWRNLKLVGDILTGVGGTGFIGSVLSPFDFEGPIIEIMTGTIALGGLIMKKVSKNNIEELQGGTYVDWNNDDNKELANITKSIEDTTKKREEKHRSK
ncbi:MAG: hypothetical protein IKQ06_04150 [Bacilli bacterium]|nr:hypothetical protein [Bacilli bacterium]